MIRTATNGFGQRYPTAIFLCLVVLFAARGVHTAVATSFTPDEPHYVGKGLYLWKTGDYHFAKTLRFHPPLTHHLGSLLLLPLGLDAYASDPAIGATLLRGPDPDPDRIRLFSRLPFIALACWGALLVFWWARECAGPNAGLLATFLYTTTPLVVASAPLVHSDGVIGVFFLQALYTFWRWLRVPSLGRLTIAGVSIGLALVSKLSALPLLPAFALVLTLQAIRSPNVVRGLISGAGGLLAMLLPAIAIVWIAYGGSFAPIEISEGPLAGWRLPSYLGAFSADAEGSALGRRVFFLGEFGTHGWWYFFPVSFAVKTPLALILLSVLAMLRMGASARQLGAYLLIPSLVYLGIAIFALDVQRYRYLLPLYPVLAVFVGVAMFPLGARAVRVTVAICIAWLSVANAWIHPHYLAYYNEAVGGPRHGYRYMVDSSLDWGQDLPGLARYLRERGNPTVHLAYFGIERPARYGIRGRPLTHCNPVTSGVVVISASVLQGEYAAGNLLKRPEPGCYDWLREHEPVAVIGYSIFVYEIGPGTREGGPTTQRFANASEPNAQFQ